MVELHKGQKSSMQLPNRDFLQKYGIWTCKQQKNCSLSKIIVVALLQQSSLPSLASSYNGKKVFFF
jgi:hypothetical protein